MLGHGLLATMLRKVELLAGQPAAKGRRPGRVHAYKNRAIRQPERSGLNKPREPTLASSQNWRTNLNRRTGGAANRKRPLQARDAPAILPLLATRSPVSNHNSTEQEITLSNISVRYLLVRCQTSGISAHRATRLVPHPVQQALEEVVAGVASWQSPHQTCDPSAECFRGLPRRHALPGSVRRLAA
jgi:hypothetical protein